MNAKEKKERELTVLRFHKASWEHAKTTYEKLNNPEKLKEAEEKIKYYSDKIEKLS